MSVRLDTRPWLTKNFADGALDTAGLLGEDGTVLAVWMVAQRRRDFGAESDPAAGSHGDGPYDRAMLLAVDIGNTNVTTGLFRNGSLVGSRRAGTHARSTPDELAHLIDALLGLDDASFGDISAIVACSVVPSLTAALETVAMRLELPLLAASAGTIA